MLGLPWRTWTQWEQRPIDYEHGAFNSNVAYTPRLVQLGFRVTF
jgi:hypothetical protein